MIHNRVVELGTRRCHSVNNDLLPNHLRALLRFDSGSATGAPFPDADMSSSSPLPVDLPCDNSSIPFEDEEDDEYHFDYMWILIGAMVLLAYLVAAVILISPIIKKKRGGDRSCEEEIRHPTGCQELSCRAGG